MKDRSCVTTNVIVGVPKIGMGIVHIQHAKLLNPNVFHEKTTKQFINKNQKIVKEKRKKERIMMKTYRTHMKEIEYV